MWKPGGSAATIMAALISWIFGAGPAFGQQSLLSGFEQSLSSTAGASWEGDWTVSPDYTATGATEGSFALAVHHSPTWNTTGTVLRGGLPLAQAVAQHDFMQIDMTTTDLGTAGDGWSPAWRQVFAVFNSNQGGWQQNQLDFPVAGDDGGSLTQTVTLDLASTGIKANAQAFVNSGGGANTYWELFLVFQGADQGVAIKAGDYNDDNVVNAADYTVWRDHLGGTSLTNETVSPGIVDAADYTEWQAHFNVDYTKITTIMDNIRFANAGSASLATSSVPEPSTLILAFVAALSLSATRGARSKNEA
jgi:hypothetical protein